MKNKKILNVCLLALSITTLITFLLPFSSLSGNYSVLTRIVYYLTNSIMVLCLSISVIITIMNLFKDNYKNLKLVETFILTSFSMVFINLILFASNNNVTINLGYILVCVQMFIASLLSQIVRLIASKTEIKSSLKALVVNPQLKAKKLEKQKRKQENKESKLAKKQKNNNRKSSEILKENVATQTEAAIDSNQKKKIENDLQNNAKE